MNFDEMQSLWNSPANRPADAAQQQLAQKFARRRIRHRRFETAWLINVFVWLTLITALTVRNVVAGKVALGAEWGVIPLLIVPWAFAIHFLRRHLRPAAGGDLSVADSLRAALVFIQAQQSDLRRVGVLLVVSIPLLAVSMWQLRAAGKVSPRELTSMAVFFSATLLVSTTGIAARYFGCLRPQQRQLEAALGEMSES